MNRNSALPTDRQFGHGVAIGDYDNDGFDDIYITNVGPDVLLQNLGDGTFTDVTDGPASTAPTGVRVRRGVTWTGTTT